MDKEVQMNPKKLFKIRVSAFSGKVSYTLSEYLTILESLPPGLQFICTVPSRTTFGRGQGHCVLWTRYLTINKQKGT